MNVTPSKIDQLPDEAMLPLQVAYDTIRHRRATQKVALARLNTALLEVGCGRISRAAFNRWALQIRTGEKRRPVVSRVRTKEPGKRAVSSPGGDGHIVLLHLFDALVDKMAATLAEAYQMREEYPEIFSRAESGKSAPVSKSFRPGAEAKAMRRKLAAKK